MIDDKASAQFEQPRAVSSSTELGNVTASVTKHRTVTHLSPSRVTPATVTSDAPSDGGDASRALSFKKDLNLKSKRESARDGRTQRPMPPDLALDPEGSGSPRESAQNAGIDESEIDHVWTAFVAHYVASAKTSADWDATWTTWVVREVGFRKRSIPPNGPSVQSADMNAPWLVAAMEAS